MKSLADRHSSDISVEILLAEDNSKLVVEVTGNDGVVHILTPSSGKEALNMFYHPFCFLADPVANVKNYVQGR